MANNKNKCKREPKKMKANKKPIRWSDYKEHYTKETMKPSTATSYFSSSKKYIIKRCLHPAIAIVSTLKDENNEPLKGILTGGEDTRQQHAADLFVCLDSLRIPDKLIDSEGILKSDTQRLIYFPIVDMSVPDSKDLDKVLAVMHDYLEHGKKVHVHCQGGHGRTGLVMACYFGKYTEVKEPIAYLRQHYCAEAVESILQHNFIKNYTGLTEPNETPYKSSVVYESSWQKRYDEEYALRFNEPRETISMADLQNECSKVPLDEDDCDDLLFDEDGACTLNRPFRDDLFCPVCNDRVMEDIDDYYYCSTCSRMYTFHELI